MRLAHTHVWPVLRNFDAITCWIATVRSASSKTMNGAWPPSWSETRLTVRAAFSYSVMPTSVLPVKVSLRTRASAKNASETAAGSEVVSTWKTSAGPPAWTHKSTRRIAVSGDCSAGLSTTEHPAASAGATLRVTMAAGKFHGVTAYTGPTGCLVISNRLCDAWLGAISP